MAAILLMLWLFVVDLFKSRLGAGSRPRICFYVINSTSRCGERHRVFD